MHINMYTTISIVKHFAIVQYASVICCSYQQMIRRFNKYLLIYPDYAVQFICSHPIQDVSKCKGTIGQRPKYGEFLQ